MLFNHAPAEVDHPATLDRDSAMWSTWRKRARCKELEQPFARFMLPVLHTPLCLSNMRKVPCELLLRCLS